MFQLQIQFQRQQISLQQTQMQIPVSDVDFYERKINRLEKDIASLNQELNVARVRLRSAQDFQIKYQLLLRQSQHQNMRAKKMQETERAQLAQMMTAQIEQINSQWRSKLIQVEESIRNQQKEEKERLKAKIQQIQKKNKEMADKSEQMDMLLFKNKKIAKDLEALQEIIEQNRKNNQRQREEDLKMCRQSLTKKFTDKIASEKQIHEETIKKQEERYEKLEIQLMKIQIAHSQNIPSAPVPVTLGVETTIQKQLEKLNELLKSKDSIIEKLQQEKIEEQGRHQQEIKYLKSYQKDLEEQIYSLHSNHQIEIINFRTRMEETRIQELKQKEKECEIVQKQHLKDIEVFNQKILKEKEELEHIRKIQEAEIHKLKEDKERLLKKISSLKDRLKQHETNQQNGETLLMLKSLKNIDNKEDELNNYEDGVTFLQRQLKKTTIKLQKKNTEIKELVTKMNHMSQQFERELQEMKQKQGFTISQQKYKIESLQQQIKELNEQLRKKEKELRDQDAEYTKKINQVNAENRSLININNDLNRDYNRILESKKVIEKSFREQRERSITTKSQIAITKKNKWLELQRQKNQIQIIYKQKEEQLKTHYQILLGEERTQHDKLKSQKELIAYELNSLKQKIKNNEPQVNQKENLYSDYHKKLATANLQIALTENLYNSLMKAKSRVKKSGQNTQKQPEVQSKAKNQVPPLSLKKAQFQNHLNKIDQKGYGSFERSIKEIEKLSENQSRHQQTSREFIQVQHDQHPLTFDDSEDGGVSPTFQMLHSFNPRSS